MKKGFTLIELLVVVLVIGILAAIALPSYQKAVARSRLSNAITMASSLARAEQVYFMANGAYTSDMDSLDISLPSSCILRESNSYTAYECDDFVVHIYDQAIGGFPRVGVFPDNVPSFILWGFDPNHYRWCVVSKNDERVELGKSICSSYGRLITEENSQYWYYSLY